MYLGSIVSCEAMDSPSKMLVRDLRVLLGKNTSPTSNK